MLDLQMTADTIFVSIASYRDPDCKETVGDLFTTASQPDRIFVGICEQTDTADTDLAAEDFDMWKNHVVILKMHASEARGPTFARYICSLMCSRQKYYLQIDSHMRFVQNWDGVLIEMFKSLPGKVVISTYPADLKHHTDYKAGAVLKTVPIMRGLISDPRGIYRPQAAEMRALPDSPVPGALVAAGFLFAESSALLGQVPFDPHLDDVFSGEEVLLSARLFTHGFVAYSPDRPIAFHKYVRPGEPRFWDRQRDDSDALRRMRLILGLSKEEPVHLKRNIKRYGIGTERSMEDFWAASGLPNDALIPA